MLSTKYLAYLTPAAAALLIGFTPRVVEAVSYASGVRDLGDSVYEFVLNDAASDVVVKRTGDSTLELGALPAGRHTFALGSGTAFDIEVSSTNPADTYTRISDDSNPFLWFSRPTGLAVNTDPTSSYFGTLYVGNGRSDVGATVPGDRPMADAIYALTADAIGVDPTTFDAETDANDTSQASIPASWTVSGSINSPFRMNLDEAGNLIVSDWGNANGGIKYASPDLQTGGLVLALQDGTTGGAAGANHAQIPSQPTVTGSVGNNLTVWALDQSLQSDSGGVGGVGSAGDGNNFWRWDVGNATDYADPANLVLDPSDLPAALNGEDTYLNLNVGVGADATYDVDRNLLYLAQNRSTGNEAGLVVVTPNGSTPTIEFSSLDFAVDNGLDGDPLALDFIVSDILRNVGEITLSPNKDALFLSRISVSGGAFDNPHLGVNSDNPGGVLVIPLDENGLPVIELSDNGTPGDTSDDQITNWTSIDDLLNGTALGFRNGTRVDAAGNLYISSNNGERVQIYSPGGAVIATTSNNAALTDGAFSKAVGTLAPGDYNQDGVVNAADYTLWRDTLNDTVTAGTGADGDGDGVIGIGDYTVWADNFGAMTTFQVTGSVPEPSAVVITLLVSAAGLATRRK